MPDDGKLSPVVEESGGSFVSFLMQCIIALGRLPQITFMVSERALRSWSLIFVLSVMNDTNMKCGPSPLPSWSVPSKKSGSLSTALLIVGMLVFVTGVKLEAHKAEWHLGGDGGVPVVFALHVPVVDPLVAKRVVLWGLLLIPMDLVAGG